MSRTKLVFATGNPGKLDEAKSLLGDQFSILGLDDIGCTTDLPEQQETLAGNAWQKATYVNEKFEVNCFADDTGLEVDALNGRPGVHSARYAGSDAEADKNIDKLLEELKYVKNRKGQFRTIIALFLNGQKKQFEGIVGGRILKERVGVQGFGYDPVFQPDGFDISFAQMSLEQKNKISHRAKALQKLTSYLKQWHKAKTNA